MKIFHIFRAPVGGLFRHVVDLASLQAEAGHEVGIIADETTGGAQAIARLARLAPNMKLGIHRIAMQRNPNGRDLLAQMRINRILAGSGAEIVHGHGSKGGLFARLPGIASGKGPLRVYTPHGGSLHYPPGTVLHGIYMKVERLLERGTDLLLFESNYAAEKYFEYVCKSTKPHQVFFNGLLPAELIPVKHKTDATDFVFIGELRLIKGVNIIIESLAKLTQQLQRAVTLNIYGTGPDEEMLKALVTQHQLARNIHFLGAAPARTAFESGRTMIMASTFESMPYVVLEAAGCAQPLISTNVGGIPEIFGDESAALIEAGSVDAMCNAMSDAILSPHVLKAQAIRLQTRIAADFTAQGMADTIEAAYIRALRHKHDVVRAA
jgi:glycosyltransferase involved in cell wall biosynthesis